MVDFRKRIVLLYSSKHTSFSNSLVAFDEDEALVKKVLTKT